LLHLGTAGFSVTLGASHGERDPVPRGRRKKARATASKNQLSTFWCCKTKGNPLSDHWTERGMLQITHQQHHQQQQKHEQPKHERQRTKAQPKHLKSFGCCCCKTKGNPLSDHWTDTAMLQITHQQQQKHEQQTHERQRTKAQPKH